ncbi:MFS transporter [Enterobacteriaceae bacterium RIT691]|nr:MFS transporter [Enterobacteriaceae bacterium RIT691]
MNSLFFALLRALRSHAWLRLMALAFIISSLGNGLTQVVVFGQLLRWHVSPTVLTFAWFLATVPGFVGSLLGEKLCRLCSPLFLLVLYELLGLFALLLPLYGLQHHHVPLLLSVQSVEALLGGMSWPALTLTFKRGLSAGELPAATAMENLIFASQVLLGTGVGVLLFERINPVKLLGIDAASFVVASSLLWLATYRMRVGTAKKTTPQKPIRWRGLMTSQKRSLLLLPALAAVGAPAMALLPALAQQLRPDNAAALALPLLFSRSLGQLCGPMLLNSEKMPGYVKHNRLLLSCLALFLFSYTLMPALAGWTGAALAAIFIAHLASNIVFALGTFSILHQFTEQHIASASAIASRWQTLSATVVTLFTVILTAHLSAIQTLWCVSFSALLLVAGVLFRYRH